MGWYWAFAEIRDLGSELPRDKDGKLIIPEEMYCLSGQAAHDKALLREAALDKAK